MGSPSSIVMGGFGNGTFAGSPSLIITMGYGIGAAAVVAATGPMHTAFGSLYVHHSQADRAYLHRSQKSFTYVHHAQASEVIQS